MTIVDGLGLVWPASHIASKLVADDHLSDLTSSGQPIAAYDQNWEGGIRNLVGRHGGTAEVASGGQSPVAVAAGHREVASTQHICILDFCFCQQSSTIC